MEGQPIKSHLFLKLSCIHWFFSGKDITKVYYNIIKDRGKEAEWYNNLDGPELKQWEKLPSLNGITIKRFSKIIRSHNLSVVYKGREAIFADGKVAQKYFIFKLLKYLFFYLQIFQYLKSCFYQGLIGQ